MARKMIFLALFCSIAYFAGAAGKVEDTDKELYKQVELFSDAITLIQSEYIEEVEPKKLVYGALEGMLSSLDDYSQFMDPESFKEMEVETKGEFGGLGIEIGIRDEILTIIAPLDGTPAEKAGLKAGDRIVKIDGELTRDIKLADAVKKLRGKPKTSVTLTVLRESEEKILDFTIERAVINIKSIKETKLVDGRIGYIKLVEFQEKTPREIVDRLLKLENEGMKALILDLRNNPGGLLDVSYEVAEVFLPQGTIVVSLKSRIADQNRVYRSREKQKFMDFPIVVLVNEGSASASEIVAGALQDDVRAIILGAKTFGKGSVQTVVPLKDGSAVRMTTAAYYTPKGHSITEKGIIPDIEVKLKEREAEKPEEKGKEIFEKLTGAAEKEEVQYDSQLQAAIDVLKGILLYNKAAD